MRFSGDSDYARWLDAQDPLAGVRAGFCLPPGKIYLDGNSLGLLSQEARLELIETLQVWETLGIEGWTATERDWYFMTERVSRLMAPLVGATEDEVVATGSTTLNLHQLLATLFEPNFDKNAILADSLAFPSDIFAIESHLRLRGLNPETHLKKVDSADGFTLSEEAIIDAMTPEVALAVLPGVLFTSGQLLDMPRLTREAHHKGILIGFDCSHSIGSVPHALSEWGVDFAFWCSYKYLNGGPGAVGGLYLNQRHFDKRPGLAGWFGSNKKHQFEMSHEFKPALGAAALQTGTPPILSLAPLHGSLRVLHQVGIEVIREKSLSLTHYLIELCDEVLAEAGIAIVTPREAHRRGGHIALAHPHAFALCQALRNKGVIADFRPPNLIRIAPVALYNGYQECWQAVQMLKELIETRVFERWIDTTTLVP
ncbi:MAG: kynureninase [Fimbriimonadia bacterium]|nr:kynureninase [Fimbriimonadia bacterium]